MIDYWGTTGTWIDRKSKRRGRGLHSLRKFVSGSLVSNWKKLPTWKEKRPTQVDLINPYNEYFHLALVLV